MVQRSMRTRGFTLIELLVVIAIIGLLSSIVLASLNTARAKSRDVKRMADLRQVATALELYFDTNNGYPSTASQWWGTCSGYGSRATSGANGWVPNLAPTYMPVLPTDPRNNGNGGCYLYNSDGANYKLLAHQTIEAIAGCPTVTAIPATHALYDPTRSPSQCTIAIFTPGAITW